MQRSTILTLILVAGASVAPAQTFDLSWFSIDGGGAMFRVGGNFELSGTIGQPDAGAMTGGDFDLMGGFWAVSFGQAGPCDPCDANCDGAIDAFDIEPFVLLLIGGGSACSPCSGDVNGDGAIDAFDIEPFVGCLVEP